MNRFKEDNLLIEQALRGEERAYEDLVRRHQTTVARVIARITRRPEWVDDLAQEVFLKAFKNLSRFRGKSGFLTWLYRIAVNESLEALRRDKTIRRRESEASIESLPDNLLVQDRESGERMVLDRELQVEVQQALSRLAPEMRAVLTLRYLEELSTTEVAAVLDLPEGTVRSRLYYARLTLAELLSPYMESAMPCGERLGRTTAKTKREKT